jgi:multiple sugar transport system permease protein
VLNAVLDKIIPGTHFAFMTEFAFGTLVTWTVWAGIGGAIIIFMAGIQGVPTDLRDAAAVDGANGIQTFFLITTPMLTPLILYQIVMGIIGGLQVLIAPILLTPSSASSKGITANTVPVHENYMFMVQVFQQSFNHQRFGYGSALLWIMFIFILLITIVFTYTSKFWVYYEVSPDKKLGEE